jgi:hypothetical protein
MGTDPLVLATQGDSGMSTRPQRPGRRAESAGPVDGERDLMFPRLAWARRELLASGETVRKRS